MSLQEDLGTYRLGSFTLTPGKVVEQMSLETISRHSKDKKVFGFSQHGFMKEKCFITWVVNQGDYLLKKLLKIVALARPLTLSPIKSSLVHYGLGKWVVRSIKH